MEFGLAWIQRFSSFDIDTDIESMCLTADLFQLPLFRSNRVDTDPPVGNLIYKLKIDTTFGVACGSYFNVAKFENNSIAMKCVFEGFGFKCDTKLIVCQIVMSN